MREEEMLMEEELYLRRQLPIIPWNGKTPTAATAVAAKATAGGDATAPTDGVLEAVKKVQQQQTHGEVPAAEVEQQQQQHESPPRVPHPPERPRRDVRPPVRLTYGGRGKPNVVQAGSVEKDEILMLLVYVDDILLFSASTALLDSAEQMLEMQFKCSKMGFTVEPCADEEVVGESDRKLFHSMVGSLNYAANHTRPDIAFATSRPKWHWVRRFLDKEVRLEIVKSYQQAADIFTKRLAEADHWKGMKLAGMSVH
ncbi:hypothetical protein CLOP_g15651 [Closterium sp. NIES-67]|nr:hypothetical protein CLOP_g15651 [Closterium sp. NIES-67]